jgi:hypothetical protein
VLIQLLVPWARTNQRHLLLQLRATGLAGICALAESASAGLYDNLVISAVAAAAGHVLRL